MVQMNLEDLSQLGQDRREAVLKIRAKIQKRRDNKNKIEITPPRYDQVYFKGIDSLIDYHVD